MAATAQLEKDAHCRRMLLIDDDPDVLDLLTVYFTSAQFIVDAASSGRAGLRLADIHRPDVVLLDLMMPRIDGLEVLERLQSRWGGLPVVILTGVEDVDRVKRSLDRGASACVHKPFDCEHLHRSVMTILTSHDMGIDRSCRSTAFEKEIAPSGAWRQRCPTVGVLRDEARGVPAPRECTIEHHQTARENEPNVRRSRRPPYFDPYGASVPEHA